MSKYNLREKKETPALYRTAIKREVIDEICEQILRKMIVEKRYQDPLFNAQMLAQEIQTNVLYVSAAVSLRFQTNFPTLIAGYRLREAVALMTDKRTRHLTMAEISAEAGFANRQSFYSSFYKSYGKSPKQYQNEFFAKINTTKGRKIKNESINES